VRSVVVGTAGHIDHGKSALVRALTGTDPDRLKEEKARGITIDLGFAHLDVGGITLAFVDVPGHERFVKNMLAGAGGIDLVMLVVAADESVMPQTREHFHICRLLQIPAGLVVLTKSDAADADMIELATLEVRELTAGSFLADAPIVVVSAKTGQGLDQLRSVLTRTASTLRERNAGGPVRLPIDRVFSVKGFGTVATGTLVSGEIHDDQELTILPRDLPVKVRGLQTHGRTTTAATAGRRIAVNLGGVEVGDLGRGDSLCTPGAFEPTRRVDAVVDILADARALRHGTRVRLHHGTSELLGRVAVAAPRGDGSAAEIPPGGSAYVRVRLEAPVVLTRGDRFILRAYSPSITIGGGVVLDPLPPRSAIRTPAGVARFRRLDPADAGEPAVDAAVAAFVGERGAAGLSRAELVRRVGLSVSAADAAMARAVRLGRAIRVADLLVDSAVLTGLSNRLLAALQAYHSTDPLSEGLPREEARERIFGKASPAVFDHVLAHLVTDQKIVARDRVALAGHQLSLSPDEVRARDTLEQLFRKAGLAPPDLAAAAGAAGVAPALADRMAKLLVRQKVLVRIEAMLFHADVLTGLKSDVRALKAGGAVPARVDVAAFKERYDISRKYAIPLLEHLDRERVTRRMGDARVVL
jgi:selenocysteine-specific elongation factor